MDAYDLNLVQVLHLFFDSVVLTEAVVSGVFVSGQLIVLPPKSVLLEFWFVLLFQLMVQLLLQYLETLHNL